MDGKSFSMLWKVPEPNNEWSDEDDEDEDELPICMSALSLEDGEATTSRVFPNVSCSGCNSKITTKSSVTREYECVNPHGYHHRFLTFSGILSCADVFYVGEPTLEHTWFKNYAWEIMCCSQCRNHLGWRYTASNKQTFFGLRIDSLCMTPT